MVLCFPVDVLVCIVLSIIVCPRVVLYKEARAPGVEVAGWDWTTMILLAKAMWVGAGVTVMSPAVAVSAVVILGAARHEVANLVTGAALCPSLQVVWAISTDVAQVTTHGTEIVHVDDWGGGWTCRRVL